MADVTRILEAIGEGNQAASAELLPLVYAELRRLAASRMAVEKPGQTLDATALVHEAYLRLVGSGTHDRWAGRGHFFSAAAEAMRRILIEAARANSGPVRGGNRKRITADLDQLSADPDDPALLDLDEALTDLAAESPIRAEVVKLRFFGGLTMPETAAVLGVSLATAERYWTYARTRLFLKLREPQEKSTQEESPKNS